MKTFIKFIVLGIIGLLSIITFAKPAKDSDNMGDYPAIYPKTKPVRIYQNLINVQLPNTIILSAEKIGGEDICMVRSIDNHLSADDKVKYGLPYP